MKELCDIGVIGLAVMGENLVLNMANHGFRVACFNRTVSRVDEFVEGRGAGKNLVGAHSLQEFCAALERPRKAMMMIKAGPPVDSTIEQLLPYLEKGDIIIDGGNSNWQDTDRRVKELEKRGILFIGTGISGGEEGALNGPSIMPGGSAEAWPAVKPIFQSIAARTDDGEPCCDWVGGGGAGHFVKMVHNGIEYGDIQLINEAYHLMRDMMGMNNDDMAATFRSWDKGDLDSYLIEITGNILAYRDADGKATVDTILDTAGQKGTGKWTVNNALELNVPLTLIAEAVFARFLSALKSERIAASRVLGGPKTEPFAEDREGFLRDLSQALYSAKLISYAQGYQLMRAASETNGWNLNYGGIALIWQGGCIIRSRFLGKIKEAFDHNSTLQNLLLDPFFSKAIMEGQAAWRRVLKVGITQGIPMPSISSALAYYDGYRTERLPANLLQAQRDYFGAHTYERVDCPLGEFSHTNWTGEGGDTSSTPYNA